MTNRTTETDDVDELGPIDYLVVEFPPELEPDGSSLRALGNLVSGGVIRVLDLECFRKGDDGSVRPLPIEEIPFTGDVDLSLFAEASSGLLDDDDLAQAASVLEPGCTGAVLIYENAWAAPFATALRRTGAQLVADGRIPVQALLASLDGDA